MSDVVEKTLASIPKILGGGSVPSSPKHASSRGFSNFLRLVVRAHTRTVRFGEFLGKCVRGCNDLSFPVFLFIRFRHRFFVMVIV